MEEHATIILQTGINNILNSKQNNESIVHQYRQLIRENIANKKIIVTSILPASRNEGNVSGRIQEVNKQLKRVCCVEGATYVEMEGYLDGNTLNREFYNQLSNGHLIHLNMAGAEKFVEILDESLKISLGISLKPNKGQVFRQTSLRPRKI